MSIIPFLKQKISKIRKRFDVQKAPIILHNDLETIAYLKKI